MGQSICQTTAFEVAQTITGLDAIPGLPYSSFGIRADRDGNYFTGVGYHMNVDGKAHIGGSLAKFARKGDSADPQL